MRVNPSLCGRHVTCFQHVFCLSPRLYHNVFKENEYFSPKHCHLLFTVSCLSPTSNALMFAAKHAMSTLGTRPQRKCEAVREGILNKSKWKQLVTAEFIIARGLFSKLPRGLYINQLKNFQFSKLTALLTMPLSVRFYHFTDKSKYHCWKKRPSFMLYFP